MPSVKERIAAADNNGLLRSARTAYRRSCMGDGSVKGQGKRDKGKRLRPERGAKSPSDSAWGWGPTRHEKSDSACGSYKGHDMRLARPGFSKFHSKP
jgi:hypothetical protein